MRFPASVLYLIAIITLLASFGPDIATQKGVAGFVSQCVDTCERDVTNSRKHPGRVAACINACHRAACSR